MSAASGVAPPLKLREAAELMRCCERTVRRRVAAGELACIRDSAKRLLFLPEHIADYFARNTHGAQPQAPKPQRNPKYR